MIDERFAIEMFRWFQKLSNKRFRAYNESLVLYYKVSQALLFSEFPYCNK